MSTISDILYEDAWRYLKQLKKEELIELVNEHRTAARYIAAHNLDLSGRRITPTEIELD